jgi:hypothetical protein
LSHHEALHFVVHLLMLMFDILHSDSLGSPAILSMPDLSSKIRLRPKSVCFSFVPTTSFLDLKNHCAFDFSDFSSLGCSAREVSQVPLLASIFFSQCMEIRAAGTIGPLSLSHG